MFYPLESRPKAVELWDAKCAKPLMLYAVFTHMYDVSVHMGEDGIYLYADGVQNAPLHTPCLMQSATWHRGVSEPLCQVVCVVKSVIIQCL